MTKTVFLILLIYLVAVNLLGAICVCLDKWLAQHQKRRIRERTLFLWAIFGGGFGVYVSMLLARHKTRHLRFMIGIPLILLVEVALLIFGCYLYLTHAI